MDSADASTRTMPTVDFEQTTTLPSGAAPFFASIASDSVKSEFTDSVSTSETEFLEENRTLAKMSLTESSDLWVSIIAGSSASGISENLPKKDSSGGLTGRSPEEVEP